MTFDLREEAESIELLKTLIDQNSGLGEMLAEESHAIASAYIADIKAGKNSMPPFKGLPKMSWQ